jgi:UDP-GlcNAc3NAcA epimerase
LTDLKICSVVGARPQFIKAAMISRAVQRFNRGSNAVKVREVLIHTGQHYDPDMNDVFFEELKIRRPDYNLGVGSGSHGEMTGQMLVGIERALLKEKPDWVVVYGDTNSTLAGAFGAAKIPVAIAHVEAGLRSHNAAMPEETNRGLTDRLSALLFAPTKAAADNLRHEGIRQGVFQVGDVMYDAFLAFRKLALRKSPILEKLRLAPGSYCLATVHRQENTDDRKRLASIFRAFDELAREHLPVIFPLHPRTREALARWNIQPNKRRVRLIAPVRYLDMLLLSSSACVVATDSGGLQKEAFFARVPCLTLREETEWGETVSTGWNVLTGSDRRVIINAFAEIADGARRSALGPEHFYGHGDASIKIVRALVDCSPFDLKSWKPGRGLS